jgi:hypothetical protein
MILLRKVFLSLLSCLLVTALAYAGNDSTKVDTAHPSRFISMSVGKTFPFGHYDVTNSEVFLKSGFGVSLLGQIPIDNKSFDFFAFKVAFSSNAIDRYQATSPMPSTEPTVQNFIFFSAMAGIFLSGNYEGVSVDGRILFGYKGLNVSGNQNGFGFDLGLDMRFKITNRICAVISIDVESFSMTYANAGLGYRF